MTAAVLDALESQRSVLLGLAYRLLGSYADAEDVVQDAWVRWAAAHGVDNAAAWLRTVVTRLCLDELRSARVRRESYVGPWLPEPVHTADGALGPLDTAELRDSLSLGFLLLLERLSPSERAVFVLREAFALPYDEVAAATGKSVQACRQLHSRARSKLGTGAVPEQPRRGRRELLDCLVAAVASADGAALRALLVDDAVLVSDGGGVVTAARRPVVGADRVARFLIGVAAKAPAGFTVDVEEVNGAPCLVVRVDGAVTHLFAVDVAGDRVRGLQVVLNPHKLTALSQS